MSVGDLINGVDGLVAVVSVGCLRVGVGALDMGLVAGKDDVDLLVGVDDLAVDLGVGVEDRTGSVGLVELMVEREVGVGVDDLVGLEGVFEVGLEVVLELVLVAELDMGLVAELDMVLDDAANVGRPVGVAGLPAGLAGLPFEEAGLPLEEAGLEPGPPEEEGLRSPALEVFNPGDDNGCLDTMLFLPVAPGWVFDSRDFSAVGRALGVPV